MSCSRVLQLRHFFPLKFDKLSHIYRDNKPGIQKVIAAIVHYQIRACDGNDKAGNFHCGTHSMVPRLQETSICKHSDRHCGPEYSR